MKSPLLIQTAVIIPFALSLGLTSCADFNGKPGQREAKKNPSVQKPLSARELFERKTMCAEIGRRYHADYERDARRKGMLAMAPKYGYNEKLNICLYAGGLFIKDRQSREIIDLYTGETLARYSDVGNSTADNQFAAGRLEFQKREEEFFDQEP